jgi:hypothetical protein
MSRLATIVAVFTLGACATEVRVLGPQAPALSSGDIQQIKEIITQRHLEKPTVLITPLSADRAKVQSGLRDYDGAQYYEFTVMKRAGRWTIVEKDISPWRTVITY